jgi:hypothetical protein
MRSLQRLGLVTVVVAAAAWTAWFGWRLDRAVEQPMALLLRVLAVAGAAGGLGAALVFARPAPGRTGADPDIDPDLGLDSGLDIDPDLGLDLDRDLAPDIAADVRVERYPHAVVAACGLPPVHHTRESVRGAAGALRDGPGARARIAAIALLEGPRRGAMVLTVAAALLLGAAPVDRPSPALLAVLAVATAGTTLAIWLLSAGAVRPGDRLVWSYASIGTSISRGGDIVGAQWAGVVGSIIALNIAISLRGVSDRWTHGLAVMTPDARVTTMVTGLLLVAGGFACLSVLTPPAATPETAPRRLEERSARRTALGATLAVAIVGLVAGVLTGTVEADGGVDAGVGDRTEAPSERQRTVVGVVDPDAAEVRDAVVDRAEVPAKGSDDP